MPSTHISDYKKVIFRRCVWISFAACLWLIVEAQCVHVSLSDSCYTRKQLFERIEDQTQYSIALNHTYINNEEVVHISTALVEINDLMKSIIEGTGCTFKITGKHIIISAPSRNKSIQTGRLKKEKQKYAYKFYQAQVLDSNTGQPLPDATISMLDTLHNLLAIGLTDKKGRFKLPVPDNSSLLKISFVGYETLYDKVTLHRETFHLHQSINQLPEVLVSGKSISYGLDRNSYLITSEIRKGTSFAIDLLEKIHGIHINKLTGRIELGKNSQILLLVDGIKYTEQYIRNLPSEQIYQVEVINSSSGHDFVEGYTGIINFILVKDFVGHEINVSNSGTVNFTGKNGDKYWAHQQPAVSITYTTNKISFYGNYATTYTHWNRSISKESNYKNVLDLFTQKQDKSNPNDSYKYIGHSLAAGINYYINSAHTLSLQNDYSSGRIRMADRYEQYLSGSAPVQPAYTYQTTNSINDHDYVGTLFYKGQINELVKLYGDLSYNYYTDEIDNNAFIADEQVSIAYTRNKYTEDKRYTLFNLKARYSSSSLFVLEGGYTNSRQKYRINTFSEERLLNYRQQVNKLYLNLSFNPAERISIKVGAAMEVDKKQQGNEKTNQLNLLPDLYINYAPASDININFSYFTYIHYPTLQEFSPIQTRLDTLLVQTGNPRLQSSLTHTLAGKITFFNRLTVGSGCSFIPDKIGEFYLKEEYLFYKTFKNINTKQLQAYLVYDQPIGTKLAWNSKLIYYYEKMRSGKEQHSVNGFLGNAHLNYYEDKYKLGIDLGYDRGMYKRPLLQGYQMENIDNWYLSFNKQWFDKRISCSLTYIFPLSLGIRKQQVKHIDNNIYREKTIVNLDTYEHMCMLKINFRLSEGKTKKTHKESRIIREERLPSIKF